MTPSLPRLRAQAGQTVYILAVTIVAMMGVVGLAVDGGRAYYYQSRMQNAVQAAADAGTVALWEEPWPDTCCSGNDNTNSTIQAATARAQTVLQFNGLPPAAAGFTYHFDNNGRCQGMTVHYRYDMPVFFIQLLNKTPTVQLSASADGRQPGVP